MIADSAVELYQCKLMVLHAAYQIEHGMDFTAVVSMAKHFVANSLWRIIDRAIQVHGALGYSTDTPLAHMLAAGPLGALRRRRRRDPPDAHRPTHDRRLQGPRQHQARHRQPSALTKPGCCYEPTRHEPTRHEPTRHEPTRHEPTWHGSTRCHRVVMS